MGEFLTYFPATVELAVSAMLLAVLLGVPAGIIAALRRGGTTDYSVMGLALTGYSMPIFWWAILLILLFSVTLGVDAGQRAHRHRLRHSRRSPASC